MNTQPIYGLVCAGGGAHGAYQVGVLKYIHEKFCLDGASPFRIFAGTSCGALNTSFFAARSYDAIQSRLELESLWEQFHIPGYHGNLMKNSLLSFFRALKRGSKRVDSPWALLDPTPMKDVIERGFRREHLEKSFQVGSTLGIGISATELISGRTCWFIEGNMASSWNLFHSIGMVSELRQKHLQASCSIPVFLPPVQIEDRYFLDGSVSLARPLSAAINMGATKILSIAADKPMSNDLPTYSSKFKPKFSHVIRMMINECTRDRAIDEAAQIQKLNQFYEEMNVKNTQRDHNLPPLPIYHEEHRPNNYHPIDLCLFFPSRRIRRSPAFSTYESGPANQARRTRFMFHEKFIKELIRFGYEDASSKHEELSNFFLPEKSRDRRWFIFAR